MDFIRDKPKSSLTSSSSEVHVGIQEEEQERLFYPSVISDFSLHIRCMFSLWEGLLNVLLSGSLPNQQQTENTGWSKNNREIYKSLAFFGLLDEEEINEIHDYHMHVCKENNNEDNTTNYHLHTMQTVYDISYYTNLIDIHIDNPLVITMNPFQVNSLLQLLNSILDQQQPTALTSKQSIDSLPIESGSVTPPNETPPNETTTQPTKPVYPVTSRFNVNAISLWLESFTFNYYMPLTLLPSSYQQHLSYTGEEKEKQSSSFPSLSSFALPYDFLILLLF